MKEKYEKYPKLFNTVALIIFWAAIYSVFPAIGAKGINPDYSVESAISLGLAAGMVIYLLPIIIAACGSFGMFFTSPIFKRRWRKFQSLKRGYYAFIFILSLFFLSFFAEFLINGKALFVKYQGKIHFTLFSFESARSFGMKGYGVPNYRIMKQAYQTRNQERAERLKAGNPGEEDRKYQEWGDDWVLMPVYPYGPLESLLDELPCRPPHPPTWLTGRWRQAFFEESLFVLPETQPTSDELTNKYKRPDWVGLDIAKLYREMAVAGLFELKPGIKQPGTFQHLLGTDDRGRDVFARMVYGFRTSLSFALVVCFFCYLIGITVGALLGYYGGTFDIVMQRFVEIWSAMPFLYTVMIFAAIMIPNFWMLVGILVIFKWMGMTYYIRAEFLREKSKDYVAAARAIGCTDAAIIFRHILPNALTPVISFAPFAVVADIGSLVSLDFLGFGLPAPTPSWGELLGQGLANLTKPWLILSPTLAMFCTLLLVSFIGEAIREAFDPKQYSRLR
ncbi:MAG TPA: ABC transporter permease subunit [Candidatus Rifleibacterium sp.]|mgnify:CR=1 FL=1|nr:ABC transporter permease subunit [Candidatus Rifleibacterium sp.]HPT47400.1 ABC transporter permease subunit [Candidatus Rifleibacterium sp.]